MEHHASMRVDGLHRRAVSRDVDTGAMKDLRDVRTAHALLLAHQTSHVSQGRALRLGEPRIRVRRVMRS
jgi:hypothetical protein